MATLGGVVISSSSYDNVYEAKKRRINLNSIFLYYSIPVVIVLLFILVNDLVHLRYFGLVNLAPIVLNLKVMIPEIKLRSEMKTKGLQFCSFCKGRGWVHIKIKTIKFWKAPTIACPKCGGRGKIDWVRNVINAQN